MKYLRIKNFGLWSTLAVNIFLLAEYVWNKNNAHSVMFIFWVQSLLLGAENVLMMLFAKTGTPIVVNNEPKKTNFISNFFAAVFFTFHYGIFIFFFGALAVFMQGKASDLLFGKWVFPTIIIMGVLALLEVPGKIIEVRRRNTSLVGLMFMPYLRLLPFALILFGSDYNFGSWLFPLFMVTKTIIDVVYLKFFNFNQVQNTGLE